jgi:hypothetical protein
MTFETPFLALLGGICTIMWAISFLRIGKKAQVYLSSQKNSNQYFSLLRGLFFLIGLMSWISISYSLTTPRKPMGLTNKSDDVKEGDFGVYIIKII